MVDQHRLDWWIFWHRTSYEPQGRGGVFWIVTKKLAGMFAGIVREIT